MTRLGSFTRTLCALKRKASFRRLLTILRVHGTTEATEVIEEIAETGAIVVTEGTEIETTAENLIATGNAGEVDRLATIVRDETTTIHIPRAVHTETERGRNVTVAVVTTRNGIVIEVQEDEMAIDLPVGIFSMIAEVVEVDIETVIRSEV